jgi:hypothetical protein
MISGSNIKLHCSWSVVNIDSSVHDNSSFWRLKKCIGHFGLFVIRSFDSFCQVLKNIMSADDSDARLE